MRCAIANVTVIATVNPATGESVRTFKALTDSEIEGKLERAAETFNSYRRTSFAHRASMLLRAAEILEKEKDHFGQLMTLEMGKPIQAARDRKSVV